MGTMQVFKVCVVEDEDSQTRWVKARVELSENGMVAYDRKGQELISVEAPKEIIDTLRVKYRNILVRDMPGACACGGTRTEQM